jgi:hypothetical protein
MWATTIELNGRRLRLGEYDRVNPKKMDLHLEKKATLIWIDHGPDN